jgi:hypothetical protein
MNPRSFQREARSEAGRDRDLERRVRSIEFMRASQLAVDPVAGLDAADVQAAIEALAASGGGGGGGGLAASFESVSKNLSAENAVLTYTGGNLTSIAYANGITKTLNYTSGRLTSIVLSGATPGGIDLTKTLSYTGSNLTGIAYS